MSIQDENIQQALNIIEMGDKVIATLIEVSDMTDSPYIFSQNLIQMTMETVLVIDDPEDSPEYDDILRRVMAKLELGNMLEVGSAPLGVARHRPSWSALAAAKHYVYLEKQLQRGLLDANVSPSAYEATTRASSVALHYLSQQSDYKEFSTALQLGRSARDVIRAQFPLTVRREEA